MAIPVGKISAYISIATFIFACFSSMYVALASFINTKDDVETLKISFSDFKVDRKERDASVDEVISNQGMRLSRIEGKLDTIIDMIKRW